MGQFGGAWDVPELVEAKHGKTGKPTIFSWKTGKATRFSLRMVKCVCVCASSMFSSENDCVFSLKIFPESNVSKGKCGLS